MVEPCNGHGLPVRDDGCWCEAPYTELDCSLTWAQSSHFGLYNTYRAIGTSLGIILTLLYFWRFIVVTRAKRHRYINNVAYSSAATPWITFIAIFDDQFRSLFIGMIALIIQTLDSYDPFAAERSPTIHGTYSRVLAADNSRLGFAISSVFFCIRFFICVQATFHQPSRKMIRGNKNSSPLLAY
jgi:hypothetical protein